MSGPRSAAAGRDGARPHGVDRAGLAYLVVGVASVGAAAVLVRLAAAPALTTSFVRLGLGSVVLVGAALVRRRPGGATGLARGDRRRVVAAGVLLALHFALWIASLSRTTVAASVVLVCLQPVFVAGIAWLVLREPTPRRVLGGIGVAFFGALMVAASGDVDAPAVTQVSSLTGNLLALGGAVAIALYVLLLRTQRGDVLVTSAWVTTTAALVLLPLCLILGAPLLPSSSTQAAWLVALALGPQVVGHTALNAALQRLPAAVVSGSILGEPVIASGLAWLFLGEQPGPGTAIGGAITLAGVAVLLSEQTAPATPRAS